MKRLRGDYAKMIILGLTRPFIHMTLKNTFTRNNFFLCEVERELNALRPLRLNNQKKLLLFKIFAICCKLFIQ